MSRGDTDPARSVSAQLSDVPDEIRDFEDRFVEAADRAGYEQASCFALRLAMEEATRNAFRHGHADLPDEPIDVAYDITPEVVTITVRDHGPGFDPTELPDPTAPENLARPHGRGVMLIRAYMTDVRFNDTGNEVTMTYRKPD